MRASFTLAIILFCGQAMSQRNNSDYLLKVKDTVSNTIGFADKAGNLVVQFGKYSHAFSDTLRTFAVAVNSGGEFIGLNKLGRELFEVYPFDNGPDYPVEGIFRIIDKGKIGYADLSGKVLITPKYQCAEPFKKGRAKVWIKCESYTNGGEYKTWTGKFIFIDKNGRVLKM